MEDVKVYSKEDYHYLFDRNTGYFLRWGKTPDDDPTWCKYGNEILDIEISTICHGLGNPCPWCYKTNTEIGKNMSFETFKQIINLMPDTLTQIAFGVGDLNGNPDLWDMTRYARSKKIIPNITINGFNLTDNEIFNLNKYMGAISVSRYGNGEVCYNAVKRLLNAGCKYVNIHQLVSEETFDNCMQAITDISENKSTLFGGLNAIVFLALKPKGNRNTLTPLTDINKYTELINYAIDRNIRFGFDSCSAPKFLATIKDNEQFKEYEAMSESCESTLFSLYCNVDGEFFPCSFTEGEEGWGSGINYKDVLEFKDIWYNSKMMLFRNRLLDTTKSSEFKNCRNCPIFKLD